MQTRHTPRHPAAMTPAQLAKRAAEKLAAVLVGATAAAIIAALLTI